LTNRFETGSKESKPAESRPVQTRDDAGQQHLTPELEREIRDLREQLQSLGEGHEAALEKLSSANKKLQSTTEKLETSKEEIESLNEELHIVKAQLSSNVDELDRAYSDLRNLFESTRVATVFLDRYKFVRAYTTEMGDIYNLSPTDRGRPLTDIVSRLDYDALGDDLHKVMSKLKPLERRVSRQDGTAHYLVRILPYRATDNMMEGSLITFVDVTGIVEAEERQRVLVDELNHRVKNMLTVVISLASQTLRGSGTLDKFSSVFLGRVHALTAAYALLSRESWSSVLLGDMITEELRPYVADGPTKVRIEGPPVPLDPRGALAFGMAIHELATNAFKYGAFSVPEGNVTVTWDVEQTDTGEDIVLEWVKRNGPPVTAPTARGFGSTLIELALNHDLSAQAKIEFLPEGARARIRAPVRSRSNGTAISSNDKR
jgi:two-component system CheB/CheR fusion protein